MLPRLPAGFDTYYEANATTASGASFIVQKKFYTCWGKDAQQTGTVSATAAANTARPGPGNATTADDKTTATSAPVAGPTANAAPPAQDPGGRRRHDHLGRRRQHIGPSGRPNQQHDFPRLRDPGGRGRHSHLGHRHRRHRRHRGPPHHIETVCCRPSRRGVDVRHRCFGPAPRLCQHCSVDRGCRASGVRVLAPAMTSRGGVFLCKCKCYQSNTSTSVRTRVPSVVVRRRSHQMMPDDRQKWAEKHVQSRMEE